MDRELIGRTIAGYRVISELGRGGMGIVYLAEEESLRRRVALKVLPWQVANNEEFLKRFRREARAAAQLNHPNVVTVYNVGQDGDCHFIAMEFVEGRELHRLIKQHGRLPVDRSLQVVRQVADALSEAHRRGIIHRDVKPQNIMVDGSWRVKVMDFGIARHNMEATVLTVAGSPLGTPNYMSPEQCKGLQVDGRSDLYSLGVVLYRMLAGRVPFDASTALVVMQRVVSEDVPDIRETVPEMPESVCAILQRLLAKSPDERYPDGLELMGAVDRALAALQSEAHPTATPISGAAGPGATTHRVERASAAAGVDRAAAERMPARAAGDNGDEDRPAAETVQLTESSTPSSARPVAAIRDEADADHDNGAYQVPDAETELDEISVIVGEDIEGPSRRPAGTGEAPAPHARESAVLPDAAGAAPDTNDDGDGRATRLRMQTIEARTPRGPGVATTVLLVCCVLGLGAFGYWALFVRDGSGVSHPDGEILTPGQAPVTTPPPEMSETPLTTPETRLVPGRNGQPSATPPADAPLEHWATPPPVPQDLLDMPRRPTPTPTPEPTAAEPESGAPPTPPADTTPVVQSEPLPPPETPARRLVRQAVQRMALLDHAGARDLFVEAAAGNDPVAAMWLARLTYFGGAGFETDEARGRRMAEEHIDAIERLAQSRDPQAMYLLATAYEDGLARPQNPDRAARWFLSAAQAGHPPAMRKTGWCYRLGRGLEPSDDRAVHWFRRAAEGGDPLAMMHLGLMYQVGTGVPADATKAAEWFRKAAELGQPESMTLLGTLYHDGRGVEKDHAAAVSWFRKAAARREPTGLNNLGHMYENGLGGLEADLDRAIELYREAAERGDREARRSLERLGVEIE